MNEKHIDSYFRNADDAQGALVKLEILGARDVTVEGMDNQVDDEVDSDLVPGIPFYAPTAQGATLGGLRGTLPFLNEFGGDTDETFKRKVLLSFRIDQQKVDEAKEIVKRCGGKL
jgi:hypothetical protein